MLMDKLVRRLIELGVDVGTKSALKSALAILGKDDTHIDELYIKIKNEVNLPRMKEVPKKERALFLSHCLRNTKKCIATMNGFGYECKHCGNCQISEIKQAAEKLGYSVYIVPGGSMVFKIINEKKPRAVIGVACYVELEQAMENAGRINLPNMGVPLLKDGCKDTAVDVKKVVSMLNV